MEGGESEAHVTPRREVIVAGIDPAVKPWRTGFAVASLRGGLAILYDTMTVRSVGDAVHIALSLNAYIVVIDSPLSLPTSGYNRSIDTFGRRMGLKLLPPMFPGMRAMVEELLRHISVLYAAAVVLETHPSSVCRAVGLDARELIGRCFDVMLAEPRGKDEVDAAIAACVGVCFLRGMWWRLEAKDGSIWLVDPACLRL